MEALFSNSCTLVFIGTVVVGVLMLAVSLVAFLVLAMVASSIHGLVILSHKITTKVFSFAALPSRQPAAASNSANTISVFSSPASVNAGKSMSSASTATTAHPMSRNVTVNPAGPHSITPAVR